MMSLPSFHEPCAAVSRVAAMTNPIRARLILAALSLSIVCAFSTLHDLGGRSPGDTAIRIASVIFGGGVAFFLVFRSARAQLISGWLSVVAALVLPVLCVSEFRDSVLLWGLFATVAALVSGFLLLIDARVRDYRKSLRS